MTEEQFDFHTNNKIKHILEAAADYQNNPEKAKQYIIIIAKSIAKASKKFGKAHPKINF